MDWIKTNEIKPPQDKYVLLSAWHEEVQQGYLRIREWVILQSDGEVKMDYDRFTHWMPLPNPPAER